MTPVKVETVATRDERKLPVFAELERFMQRVRERAYAAFEGRGFVHGNALTDWLNAEREMIGASAKLVEHPQSYSVEFALAGFDPKNISVTATPKELVICAKMSSTRGDKIVSKSEQVNWSELRSGDIYRSVECPTDIEVDKVTAQYDNGLLTIVAPKADSAAVRTATAA